MITVLFVSKGAHCTEHTFGAKTYFYALRLFSALVRAPTAPRAAGAWGVEAVGVRWDAGWAVLSARRPGTATSLAAATAGRAAAACGT